MSTARKWMVAALVAVVVGSFAVSASATLHLGSENNMHGLPQLALVLVLEVAAVTGTAIYVATQVRRVRIKAGAVVVGATGVAIVGGLSTYSLLGVVAPLAMVVVVELIADFWHVVTDQPETTKSTETTSVHQPLVEAEPTPDQVVDQPDEQPVDESWWRDQRPTEADYAAVVLDHLPRDGQRLTQQETLEALQVVSPNCTLYRVKEYRRQSRTLEVAS